MVTEGKTIPFGLNSSHVSPSVISSILSPFYIVTHFLLINVTFQYFIVTDSIFYKMRKGRRRVNNNKSILFQVIGELNRSELQFQVCEWKLLIETNKYLEIKAPNGVVKRIYKEKLNVVIGDTKYYADGQLSCSAFCSEDDISNIKTAIVTQLKKQIAALMSDLQINQIALSKKMNNDEL